MTGRSNCAMLRSFSKFSNDYLDCYKFLHVFTPYIYKHTKLDLLDFTTRGLLSMMIIEFECLASMLNPEIDLR